MYSFLKQNKRNKKNGRKKTTGEANKTRDNNGIILKWKKHI